MGNALEILVWIGLAALVLASILPLSKIPFGAIRGLEFPREQFLFVALLLGVLAAIVLDGGALVAGIGVAAAVAALQLAYIVKFTPLWWRQSLDASDMLSRATDRQVSLIAANVKLSNRDYDRLITLIREQAPDIVIAIEVDQKWIKRLEDELSAAFEHWVRVPLDNGYGLCVMSRLPLEDVEVRDLITEDVPSIRCKVILPSGAAFRLYAVHPEPPIIDHDTKGRDSEIALVGMEAAEDSLPAIVTGDLNDVAWSTTTRRFQRLSRLLDPRVGRGFFNTFNAFYWFARWPLDHMFHDPQFRLIGMDRLQKIGSDHFPMKFVLVLSETERAGTMPEKADKVEKSEVKDMIEEEKERDREAIGSDWEEG